MPEANPRLSVAADLASLELATEFARSGAAAAGLPENCWGHLDLVVEGIDPDRCQRALLPHREPETPGRRAQS